MRNESKIRAQQCENLNSLARGEIPVMLVLKKQSIVRSPVLCARTPGRTPESISATAKPVQV